MKLQFLYLICYVLIGVKMQVISVFGPSTLDMCELPSELALEAHGEMASVTVALNPMERRPVCRLRVTAPRTHIVNLQFVDAPKKVGRLGAKHAVNESEEDKRTEECIMSIYLPDNPNTPFWKGDPCSADPLPEVDLLTNDFKIVWNPPENPWNTNGRTFYLTAVGSGAVCRESFQHTCLRIGRVPMLCVSQRLTCDGRRHCPRSSSTSDEDENLCREIVARNKWERLAQEFIKKFRPPPSEGTIAASNGTSDGRWSDWQLAKRNGTLKSTLGVIEENHNAGETISQMLNKYGPWGYLMLGLLICGTVLFFCGLWECCCRKPKPDVDGPPNPSQSPTTVLVMNCGEINPAGPTPPNYDDLDQPPSYTTLFPNLLQSQASRSAPKDTSECSSVSNPDNETVCDISVNGDIAENQPTST